MGDSWLPPAEIGHNNPPSKVDPGPDLSHRIGFQIPEWVPRDQVLEFERILQAQGPFPDRLAALDNAAYRVRAHASVSHRGFRLYDGILDMSKGEHRCCLLDLDKLGFIVGILDRANSSKVLDELEQPGLVKTLRFTEGRLRAPKSRKVLIAPIITAEDRRQGTVGRVLADAEAAKKSVLEKRAEAERVRYHDRKRSSGYDDHQTGSPKVEATTRHSSGQSNNGKPVSGGRGDFSSSHGNHLLNHIDKPQKGGATNSASQRRAGSWPQANGKAEMAAALNPEVVYAERNVTVLPSGKLVIGDEFRAELLQAFTHEQIEGGVDCALAAMGIDRNKVKILQQVRRQCTFKRDNDKKSGSPKAMKTFQR